VWSISPSEADGFKEKCGRIVLTDDYSPTDNLTAPIARQNALRMASNRHIENANRLRNLGSGNRFISEYFEAIRVNPGISLLTYYEIAKDLMTAGEFEEATEVCKKALKCYDGPEMRKDISPIYLCMGAALKNRGQDEEAGKCFQKVIEEHTRRMGKGAVPVEIVAELGMAFVGVGNYAEAVRCFERAVKTEPANSTYRYMLSEMLIEQKDYAGAQAAIEDAINAMKQAGNEEAVSDFHRLLGQIAYQKSIEQTKQP
jgi:tetratricopeptide (TPR) repeat protein